ncbi:MIP/aquaporin family protein [Sphingomonas humi]|uniref:MIP/aquaporin family protein n=1 Tax=Sphingomonas humi TaxID=335630 RepID=UPI0031CEA64E
MSRRAAAEALGSFFLFATVIGSGIMAERLASGNVAVALMGNTVATGAMLFALIGWLGPISGAHLNPAVSLVAAFRRELSGRDLVPYLLAQLGGGIVGVITANLMFDMPAIAVATKVRGGPGQWLGEAVATFGLILTILGTVRYRERHVPAAVALYIVAAYWFTSSTSFANPAITVARSLSDSFAGISPGSVPLFIVAQLLGAAAAAWVAKGLIDRDR